MEKTLALKFKKYSNLDSKFNQFSVKPLVLLQAVVKLDILEFTMWKNKIFLIYAKFVKACNVKA